MTQAPTWTHPRNPDTALSIQGSFSKTHAANELSSRSLLPRVRLCWLLFQKPGGDGNI